MGKNKINLLFGLVLVLVIMAFAFEGSIRKFLKSLEDHTIFDTQFYTLAGKKFNIPQGHRGYVVFHSDLAGCKACLRKIGDLKELAEIYEGVSFFAILKGDEHKESFLEFLDDHQAPGQYLMDPDQDLFSKYGLADHPHLMFFNRLGKLMATIPYNVELKKLNKTYHLYINEM